MSDKVIRCGYKVGGGADRDQNFDNNYACGGKTKKECKSEGGPMHGVEVGNRKTESYTREFNEGGQTQKRNAGGAMNPQAQAQAAVAPRQNAIGPSPQGVPINLNYGLKKGGKANIKAAAKGAVKQILNAKETKPAAALIEAISILPRSCKTDKKPVIKKEVSLEKKAIGGAAKIRQGTFGLKAKPLIKR